MSFVLCCCNWYKGFLFQQMWEDSFTAVNWHNSTVKHPHKNLEESVDLTIPQNYLLNETASLPSQNHTVPVKFQAPLGSESLSQLGTKPVIPSTTWCKEPLIWIKEVVYGQGNYALWCKLYSAAKYCIYCMDGTDCTSVTYWQLA